MMHTSGLLNHQPFVREPDDFRTEHFSAWGILLHTQLGRIVKGRMGYIRVTTFGMLL